MAAHLTRKARIEAGIRGVDRAYAVFMRLAKPGGGLCRGLYPADRNFPRSQDDDRPEANDLSL